MTIQLQKICEHLKSVAPLNLAEDWDNVGLLLGDETSAVSRIMTCLTLTSDVADEAVKCGASLVVTHHPILFKSIKQITSASAEGRILQLLLGHGIAVYSPHTAWDNSSNGINQQLAALLELQDIVPLRKRAVADHLKITTFVPESHLDNLRQAVWNSGAGVIGNYRQCSFNVRGTGTFFGTDESNPSIGETGRLESVDEIRVEFVSPPGSLHQVLAALRAAHPYEEPAIDIVSVKSTDDRTGSGRCGRFAKPITLGELNHVIATRLKQTQTQFVGDPNQVINRLGIACGAAAEYLRDAHRAGCQAFLTGEARFHSCIEATEMGLGMILPGHYATERFSMEVLAQQLGQQFPTIAVAASRREQDPVRTYLVQ